MPARAVLADEALTALEGKTKQVESLQASMSDKNKDVAAMHEELEMATDSIADITSKVS